MTERPEVVGPYRIVGQLGQGGMGVVYEAQHGETGERVALKTVTMADATLLAGIRREIHALARLRHPGIVRIVAEGMTGSVPWYAMELVAGRSLGRYVDEATARLDQRQVPTRVLGRGRDILDGGRSDAVATRSEARQRAESGGDEESGLPVILTVIRRLCVPIRYMHGEGLVHRDLKPANVIVRSDGVPLLIDFGLIRRFAGPVSRDELIVDVEAAGTLGYMAPEQLMGEDVDARADLYALGCMMYELLTGRLPLAAPDGSLPLDRLLHATPEPPSVHAPWVPPEVDAISLRLLERDPRNRLGYADDLARALEDLGALDGVYASAPRPRTYLYRPAFSGRGTELDLLASHLPKLRKKEAGLLAIGGESGAGKTRLAMELARRAAEQGIEVMVGDCSAVGSEPLQGLRHALRAIAEHCARHGRAESDRVVGHRGKVLASFEPLLGRLPGHESFPEAEDLGASGGRQRLLAYAVELLAAYAERSPLLLLVDDAQWADDLTIRLMEQLCRAQQTRPGKLAVVVTYRGHEMTPELEQLLRHAGERVELSRLAEDGVGAIVRDMLALQESPRSLLGILEHHAAGNPFFVAEYLRSAVENGVLHRDDEGRWCIPGSAAETLSAIPIPASVSDVVARRVEALAPGARRVMEAIAVLGTDLDAAVLSAMTDPAVAPDGIADLVTAQIVRELPGGALQLGHDTFREVTYGRLSEEPRTALHRSAAEALEGELAAGQREHLASLGLHWERCGNDAMARTRYLEGARHAVKHFAFPAAEQLYRSYLRLVPDDSVERAVARRELGHGVLGFLGRNAEAAAVIEESVAEARSVGSFLDEGEGLRALAITHYMTGDLPRARGLYEQSYGVFAAHGEDAKAGLVRGHVARLLHDLGQMDEAKLAYEEALVMARRAKQLGPVVRLLVHLGEWHRQQGNRALSLESLQEALETSRIANDRFMEGAVHSVLATVHWQAGDLATAHACAIRGLEIRREIGDRRNEASSLGNLALILQAQGEDPQGTFEQGLLLSREIGDRMTEGITLENLAQVLTHKGDAQGAEAYAREAIRIHREMGNAYHEGISWATLGGLDLELGRLDAARESLERGARMLGELGCVHEETHARAQLGAIHLSAGRHEEARKEFLEVGRRAESQKSHELEIQALLGLVALSRLDGRVDAVALARLQLLAEATERPDLSALGLTEVACALLAQRQPWRAREILSTIVAIGAGKSDTRGQVLVRYARAARRTGDVAGAASAIAEAETVLARLPNRLALALCACERGLIDLARGVEPEPSLARAEGLAREAGVLPTSEVAQEVGRLSRSITALASGRGLVNGEDPDSSKTG